MREFLDSSSHQLTDAGLEELRKSLHEVTLILSFINGQDELTVFFRNNHFSTLTKHAGALYNLVTDIGYERERNIMWDLLATVLQLHEI